MEREAILVVDDDESVRNFAARVLRAQGYEVFAAASAEETVRVLASAPPLRLLITDMDLGGSTGATVAALAAAARPGIRVLYMSGGEAAGWADGPYPGGFLAKPFDAPALLATVRGLLG